MLGQIRELDELTHLKAKLPIIPPNLFQEVKTSNFGRLNRNLSDKQDFQVSDYLNPRNSILGLQVPLSFKTYVNFESNCHEYYDLLLGTQLYRQKVGEYYQSQPQATSSIDEEILQNRQRYNSNTSQHSHHPRSSSHGMQQQSHQAQPPPSIGMSLSVKGIKAEDFRNYHSNRGG